MARILVIDDELPLRRVLRSILERAGHTVLDAPDGREGMALCQQEPTDVVVTDIFMPEKDGVEVILELKKLASKPKIIAMSGGGRKGLFEWNSAALALGADRVLVKPFDPQTVLLTVQEVLGDLPDTNDAVLPSGATDQRKYPRFPVFLPVSYGDGVIAQTGTVVDISREGGRIRGTGAVPEMKYFRAEIRLDDPHATLTVNLAVMRWSRNGEFGVEFIRMEPDQQARLQRVIRNCEEARSRQDHRREVQGPLLAISL
jgi:CheY-like chemotaxis protein